MSMQGIAFVLPDESGVGRIVTIFEVATSKKDQRWIRTFRVKNKLYTFSVIVEDKTKTTARLDIHSYFILVDDKENLRQNSIRRTKDIMFYEPEICC